MTQDTKTQLDAWYRGINPYPRLTMDESFALIGLMSGRSLTDNEYETSSRLQRKACGISEAHQDSAETQAPRCVSCGKTNNLTEVIATPDGTYHLCREHLAEEEQV